MARLIYAAITSLDGYVEDDDGAIGWAAPDEELHTFVNDLARPVGTYLYGRRMYETMVFWETAPILADEPAYVNDFAEIWRTADKVVYSTSLTAVSSDRTTIEREFDPDRVRQLKAEQARDISVGGPALARQAIEAGLVDEFHQFVAPVVVGGGKRFLPPGFRFELELVGGRIFASGVAHLHYQRRG